MVLHHSFGVFLAKAREFCWDCSMVIQVHENCYMRRVGVAGERARRNEAISKYTDIDFS